MDFSKRVLSQSTNGRALSVTGTSATGSLIHTSVTGANAWDEVYLWAVNTATVDKQVTIEWAGSTGQAGQPVALNVPSRSGPNLVIPGWPLGGGRRIRAFAATASVVTIHGFVNRIEP